MTMAISLCSKTMCAPLRASPMWWENRHLMERSFPDLLADLKLRKVSDYGTNLFAKLSETAPEGCLDKDDPQVVVMSPGMFNSAYFEHIFLAREMGVPVVEGNDLFCDDDKVYMKTIGGPRRVDVIYRRIDDEFLDPDAFRPDSMLGVKGLVSAMLKGNVTIANALGTGVADDKAVYAYMPRIIKYYLDEDPILANVKTRICREQDALQYTLDHLDELVIKPVGESGGYGITIGPMASKEELDKAREALLAKPSNFIAQPMISLSVCPTLGETDLVARHVDLPPLRHNRQRHLGSARRAHPCSPQGRLPHRQFPRKVAAQKIHGFSPKPPSTPTDGGIS